MHISADAVAEAIQIPILHIADATAERIARDGMNRIGLLGTAFTMERDFYKGRLTDRHALDVLVPPAEQREIVHRIIYEQLCRGRILEDSRAAFRRIVRDLVESGAEGVILGCTEIGLLLGEHDSPVPLFDTTRIHAEAAVERALS
jgi:aspartate racemase